MKSIYLTTPIYYVTDAPHIGHLYSTLAADILARYYRLSGWDVRFLTGTDEHGQKIQKKAKELGETPQALADRVVERYREAWKVYGVQYDDFIRTTESRHKEVVLKFIQQLMDQGDIYFDEYEGWYCVPCESYWGESQLKDGKCPDCDRPVEKLKEESYFFKLSAYEKPLKDHIEKNPDFIFPKERRNEVLGFLNQGLKDISISRTTIQWGIDMPSDGKAQKLHKVYVWIDALTNYYSALLPLRKESLVEKYWGNAHHLVGKDIVRFHAVYWPAMLLALKLPLPKKIVAHGWLTLAQKKIGKSLGNAVDPLKLAEAVSTDGVRYFLFREFPFGLDGEYTEKSLYLRLNADLANDFGNGISRVVAMIEKSLGKEFTPDLSGSSSVHEACEKTEKEAAAFLEGFRFDLALESIWSIVGTVNRFLEEKAPWKLAKDPALKDEHRRVLSHAWEGLRVAARWVQPFLPDTSERALKTLGAFDFSGPWSEVRQWGYGPKLAPVEKGTPIFARLEVPEGSQ